MQVMGQKRESISLIGKDEFLRVTIEDNVYFLLFGIRFGFGAVKESF